MVTCITVSIIHSNLYLYPLHLDFGFGHTNPVISQGPKRPCAFHLALARASANECLQRHIHRLAHWSEEER